LLCIILEIFNYRKEKKIPDVAKERANSGDVQTDAPVEDED
jgi:hypothetical protein